MKKSRIMRVGEEFDKFISTEVEKYKEMGITVHTTDLTNNIAKDIKKKKSEDKEEEEVLERIL